MERWDVRSAYVGKPFYKQLLEEGWEPFAVTVDELESETKTWKESRVWFRKCSHKRTETGTGSL